MKQLICCTLEKPLFGLAKWVIEKVISFVSFRLTSFRTLTSSDGVTFTIVFFPSFILRFLLFCISIEPKSMLSQVFPSNSGSNGRATTFFSSILTFSFVSSSFFSSYAVSYLCSSTGWGVSFGCSTSSFFSSSGIRGLSSLACFFYFLARLIYFSSSSTLGSFLLTIIGPTALSHTAWVNHPETCIIGGASMTGLVPSFAFGSTVSVVGFAVSRFFYITWTWACFGFSWSFYYVYCEGIGPCLDFGLSTTDAVVISYGSCFYSFKAGSSFLGIGSSFFGPVSPIKAFLKSAKLSAENIILPC